MSVVRYEFEKLISDNSAHAARLAVLWPLVPMRDGSETDQLEALRRLRSLWVSRVSQLQEAGWEALTKARDATYPLRWTMQGCHPTMAVVQRLSDPGSVTPKSMLCGASHVCPWCYARRVADFYDVLAKVVAANRDSVIYTSHGSEQVDTGRPLTELMRQYQLRMKRFAAANDLFDGLSYSLVTEPRDDCWQFTYRFLALGDFQNCEHRELYWAPEAWTTRTYRQPDRAHIAAAVSETMRYPTGLMYGRADMTATLLNFRSSNQNFQTANVLGAFRGVDSKREAKAKERRANKTQTLLSE